MFDWFKKKMSPKKNAQNKQKYLCEDKDGKVIELSEEEVNGEVPNAMGYMEPPPPTKADKITFKLWCDDRPGLVLSDNYMDALEEARIDVLAIMVNKSNVRKDLPGWKRVWTDKQIRQLANMLSLRNIGLAIEKWPRPDKDQIDEMTRDLFPICKEVCPVEIGDDGESNWNKKFLSDFSSMDDAAKYLLDANEDLCAAAGCAHKTYTTFAGHWEYDPKTAIYSKMVDFNDDQLYSVQSRRVNKKDVKINWNHQTLGPGNMQHHYLPSVISIGPEVGCALAFYDQKWQGHTEEEAVMKAFRAARSHGITRFAGWSSKWIVGKFAQNWTIPVIKKMKEMK